MTEQIIYSSLQSDQPADDDYLDFGNYIDSLDNLISNLDPKTGTPMTIGIIGRWGTGKTTLMKKLQERFKPNADRPAVTTVWFNAWQYSEEENLWSAFLQCVINSIESSLLTPQKKIEFKIDMLKRRVNEDTVISYLLGLLLVISALIGTYLLAQIESTVFPPQVIGTGGVLVFMFSGWNLVKSAIETYHASTSINFSDFWKKSDYKEHIAFIDKFREHFIDILACLPKSRATRLIVFIDDLDRCPTERILQVLDTIKMFLDIPGCVYIIGMDDFIIKQAVTDKYTSVKYAQKEYLDKIIQLPFYLPPLSLNQMKKFVSRLTTNLPDSRCGEVFAVGLPYNPREVKRAINNFSLLWNLTQTHADLAQTIKPILLAKIIVLQQEYSDDLFLIIKERPDLLIELEEYFRSLQKYADELKRHPKSEIEPDLTQNDIEKKLLQILTESFTLSELQSLAFSLSIDLEEFPPGGKSSKAQNLISRIQRDGQLSNLTAEIIQRRPQVSLPEQLIAQVSASLPPPPPDPPQELDPFKTHDKLRRMLLLFDMQKEEQPDEYNFSNQNLSDLFSYFTLASHQETQNTTNRWISRYSSYRQDLLDYSRNRQENAMEESRTISKDSNNPIEEHQIGDSIKPYQFYGSGVNLDDLLDKIFRSFDVHELNELSFILEVEFDNLEGNSRESKIISLIQYCNMRGRIGDLIEALRRKRPNQDW